MAGLMRFDDLVASAEKLPGYAPLHLKLTFRGSSLALCHLDIVSGLPSSLLTSVVVNEQGVDGRDSIGGTDGMSDSMINNLLFGGGG